ncbi:MAG: hypothetical protein ABIJ45_09650 [Candidatus Zixiibacteriota bacterium]
MFIKAFLTLFIILISVVSALAEVPGMINYQGRLTDPSGDPVPDGNYTINFRLYNVSSAGTAFWSESHTDVTITDGMFNIILGADTPITETELDNAEIYLEIEVEGNIITPRTKMVSSAYAIEAGVADSLKNDIYLNESGDTLRGTMRFDGDGLGIDGFLSVGSQSASLFFMDNGISTMDLYGQSYGSLYLYDQDGTRTAALDATNNLGAIMQLSDSTGSLKIHLDAGKSGNSSVVIPDNAIDADEILDEPGIASVYSSSGVDLGRYEFTDLETVSITIPAPGYIYLWGTCYVRIAYDTANFNGAYLQIDETAGGTSISATGTRFYRRNIYGDTTRTSIAVDRVYYKPAAGTYEFRLEGRQYISSAAIIDAYNSKLTAIYIASSYATVKNAISDPGDNPEAIPIELLDENENPTGDVEYEVDLRYYELKAKKAKIEALEAELELMKARESESRR